MKRLYLVSIFILSLLFVHSCTKSKKELDGNTVNRTKQPPNIIWIMADDLGYGDLGSYGQEYIRTPYLDQMAAEGIRFTQFYAGHAVCAPTRSSLMTGQHTGYTPIRGNWSAVTGERVPLAPQDTTIAQILQKAGYTTGLIGKWGLGEPGTTGVPQLKGFDYFWGFLNQARAHTYYPEWVWRNENRVVLTGNRDILDIYPNWKVYPLDENGSSERKQVQYSHDLDMHEAEWFVRANRDGPFFLYLALQIPHAELVVPEESLKEYLDENGNSIFDEVPNPDVSGTRYAYTDKPIATYAAMVTRMDRDIGQLLALLRKLGIAENTLVLFTSDNGTHAEGGYNPGILNSNGPLRGIKRDLYEGGIRVPMIAWMPGTVPSGRVSDKVWAMWDFMPTAAELAGTRPTQSTNGISMVKALLDQPQEDHEYLYWEYLVGGESRQAVRIGDWKAVRYGFNQPTELYDLSVDIGEKNDIASDYPDIVFQAEELFRTARMHSDHYPLEVKPSNEGSENESNLLNQ
jgi:arylsulfatase A-like enzyme